MRPLLPVEDSLKVVPILWAWGLFPGGKDFKWLPGVSFTAHKVASQTTTEATASAVSVRGEWGARGST